MEFEFDKEIDALLRQTSRNGGFVSNQSAPHLDADEISAFAENALPEKTKQRYTIHLADCDKCRKSLSNVILLNSEAESEPLQKTAENRFVAPPIPWYRKLFVFPNLAYTMGALVLVFSSIAAYTVLQSVGDSQNAEVSQTYDRQPAGKGMSSDGDALPNETFSSNSATAANTMMSNTASASSTSNSAANITTAPSGLTATANSNAAGLRTDAEKDVLAQPKPASPSKETVVTDGISDVAVTSGPPPPPPIPARENEYPNLGEVSKQQNEAQNSIAQNQTQIMPDSRNVQRAPTVTMRAEEKSRKVEESRDDASGKLKVSPKKSAPKNDATRVGGKTFNRENNVWYDSTYRGQTTVNVTRGTTEYKKLDSGLRQIAENLGGTVVVVWKNKAYRIQ